MTAPAHAANQVGLLRAVSFHAGGVKIQFVHRNDFGGGRILRASWRQRILSIMSTISVSDLQKKPAKQWLQSARKGDLVITSKGQPVAVLIRIPSASMESTRALLRSVRALQAQASLQQAAAASGASELSMPDIDAEIAASRRALRRK